MKLSQIENKVAEAERSKQKTRSGVEREWKRTEAHMILLLVETYSVIEYAQKYVCMHTSGSIVSKIMQKNALRNDATITHHKYCVIAVVFLFVCSFLRFWNDGVSEFG